MRSRYSAYVNQNNEYLRATWAAVNLPKERNLVHPEQRWLNLTIHHVTSVSENEGYVTFTATCMEKDRLCALTEKSRFIKKKGRWYYHSGNTECKSALIAKNGLCPCGSKKKFKRCCMKKRAK